VKTIPRLVLVAAIAENGVIGHNGRLPWKIPGDLKHFKKLTMGKPVVMGRSTYESMGGPLKGRVNIVLTRDQTYKATGAVVAKDLDSAIALAVEEAAKEKTDEIAIIGGNGVFEETLPRAFRLEITEVHGSPEGDTYFPKFDKGEWKEIRRDGPQQGKNDSLPYTFITYERRRAG
jgi:dihydrofolate reductase